MKNNLKNICIIRDDRLGDTILTLPIVKQIKKEYPNSQITLIISKISEDLIKLCDYVDKYLVFSNNKIINQINSQNFDLIINFSPIKNRTYKFFLNAKRKINIIYLSRYKRDNKVYKFLKISFFKIFFHKNYLYERYDLNSLQHHTSFMNKILNSEKILTSTEVEKLNYQINSELKYDYFIHLSNKWLKNNYESKHLVSLVRELNKRSNNISFSTDFFLSEEMKLTINEIKKNFNLEVFIGPNFNNWINLLNQSGLIITPECGCSHVSGFLNKKVIIVYDENNKPEFIKKEYHPYFSEKIIQIDSAKGKDLNKKILELI